MVEVDNIESLKSKLKQKDPEKNTSVVLRAALRDFPPVNVEGNMDASQAYAFPAAPAPHTSDCALQVSMH